MNHKKRLIPILIVVVVLSLTVFVSAFESYEILDWGRYCEEATGCSCDDPDECDSLLTISEPKEKHETLNNYIKHGRAVTACTVMNGEQLPASYPYSAWRGLGTSACYIGIREEDGPSDGADCGWVAMPLGGTLGYNGERSLNILKNKNGETSYVDRGWSDSDVQEFLDDDPEEGGRGEGKVFKTPNKNELLCGEDEKWSACSPDFEGGFLSFDINNPDSSEGSPTEILKYFYCLKNNENAYVWVDAEEVIPSVDSDSDHIPDYFDCAPDNDKIYPAWGLLAAMWI